MELIKPYHECPEFEDCSCNKCPLDPDAADRFSLPDDPEPRCKAWISTRTAIGIKYHLPNKGMTKVDEEIKEIRELQAARAALLARMRVIQQLQLDRTQVVHLFDDLVRQTPEGVYFTSLKQAGRSITLQGVAQSNARVSALMRKLDGSDWFAAPELDVINVRVRGNDRVREFSLRVTQKVKQDKDGAAP